MPRFWRKRVPLQAASLYELPDRFVAVALHESPVGLLFDSEVSDYLPRGAPDEALGQMVRRMLDASRSGVEPPPAGTPARQRTRALLRASELKSYSAVVDVAAHVSVGRRGEVLTFEPSRNGAKTGETRGFLHLAEGVETRTKPDDQEIGRVVREVFGRCC